MPEISGSDDVVLRLSLRMDPGEAARMARMTGDEVKRALGGTLSELEGAHKRLAAAMTAETQKQAKEEIKAYQQRTRELTAGLKEIEREQKRAAHGMSVNWRRHLEDIENVTVAGFGVKAMIQTITTGFISLSREIINTSNIFGSLKISIDAAREATGGTVKDLELIAASNRAAEVGLELTGEQFGYVAAQADKFADATGSNGAEAMDKLIKKLASGSAEGLRHAGVIVDAQKEYDKLSEKLHVSVEKLTEEEKRMAIVSAALEVMQDKFNASGDDVEKFGGVLERTFTQASNVWDRTLGRIGNAEFDQTQQNLLQYTSTLGIALGLLDKATERLTETDNDRAIKALKEGAAKARAENEKARMEAQARGEYIEGGSYRGIVGRGTQYTFEIGSEKEGKELPSYFDDYQKDALARALEEEAAYWSQLTDYQSDQAKRLAEFNAKNEEAYQEALGMMGAKLDEKTMSFQEPATGGAAGMVEKYTQQAFGGQYTDDEQKQFVAAQGKAMESFRELEIAVAESRAKAGGGLVGQLLFGDDTSLDQTYEKLDAVKRHFIDSAKEMTDFARGAYEAMAGAMGSALAKSIGETGEGTGFKEALKAQTHAVLMGLSQQAYVKSLMEGAEALASLAMGNFPGAAAHGAAAAAFAGVGTAAAFGARATFTAPAATGSTPTSVRGSSAGYGSSSGRSSSGGGDESNVFKINVMFGDEETVAKAIGKAIEAYKQKNGKMPPGMN